MTNPANDDARHAAATELVRDARALSGRRHRPAGVGRGVARKLMEVAGEVVLEAIATVIALAIFAGISAATLWSWLRSPAATIATYLVIGAFLTYGAYTLWSGRRDPASKISRPRIAAVAAGSTITVAVWLTYILSASA